MKNQLTVPVSPDPVTGLPRQAALESCIIYGDTNLTLRAIISYLTADGNKKLDSIAADTTLSTYQKQIAAEQFADRITTRQTGGSFVMPATGQLVPEDTPGAIPQSQYFWNLYPEDIIAMGLPIEKPTMGQLINAMITMEILKSDQRKEI